MKQQTYGEWMRSNPQIPNLTAVEWLQETLKKLAKHYDENSMSVGEYRDHYLHYFKIAKAMEKEQILDAWVNGNDNEPKEVTQDYAEQYYNETYGGQGSPDTTTSQTTQNK